MQVIYIALWFVFVFVVVYVLTRCVLMLYYVVKQRCLKNNHSYRGGVNVLGILDSVDQLPHKAGQYGDAYFIDDELHLHNGERFMNSGSLKGPVY